MRAEEAAVRAEKAVAVGSAAGGAATGGERAEEAVSYTHLRAHETS